MYRTYQMARIIKVAELIHSEPRKWTRPRLAERFKVNKAAIQRDINLLCEMGIEVIPCGKQGYEMISDFFLPALNLDFEEVLALITAVNFYRAAEGEETGAVITRVLCKITAALPKEIDNFLNRIVPQIEVPHLQMSEMDETDSSKDDLYRAIRERRSVVITYNSFSSWQKVQHRLSPYAVLFRKRSWYVIGRSERLKQVLAFRINRIESLRFTELGYTIPADFSVKEYLAKSWDVMLEPEARVVILFAPRIAPLMREVTWHSTQQIREKRDGSLRFEVTVASWREIGWWVLGWGHEAEVIEPRELRRWIALTAQAMVALYTGKWRKK